MWSSSVLGASPACLQQTAALEGNAHASMPQASFLRLTVSVLLQAEGPDGTVVAVKALSLRRMTDWKQLELFEREAKTLKSLDHPGIPKYIDYLSEDTEKDRGFFLVQASLSHANSFASCQIVHPGRHRLYHL